MILWKVHFFGKPRPDIPLYILQPLSSRLLLKGVPLVPGCIRPGNHRVSWPSQLLCSALLIYEGHKPSVSREGQSSRCRVLLPCVVCLQEDATWLCVCVCASLSATGLDGDVGPNDFWVSHKLTACWEHLAGTARSPTLGCQNERLITVHSRAALTG